MITEYRIRLILIAIVLVSLVSSSAYHVDYHIAPHISEERYAKVVSATKYLVESGWTEPIYVSYGLPGIWYWSIDRAYIGIEVGLDWTYYGKLQELYFLAPALNESSYRYAPTTELSTARTSEYELGRRFGADLAAIRQRPVVFIAPDSYNRSLSEWFASRYHLGNGIFIIPPGVLSELDVNRWRLFGGSDYVWKTHGESVRANWSIAPEVLEVKNSSAGDRFLAAYRFGTSISAAYTIQVRLMDFPSRNDTGLPYATLTFLVDGMPFLTHQYGGTGPIWLSASTGILEGRMHTLEIRTGAPGMPITLGIDTIEIEPS